MRILIVGGGISGLSIYLFFRKLLPSTRNISVSIHESVESSKRSTDSDDSIDNQEPETIGAGLGVSPNGMQVLRHLDPEIHDAVVEQGYPVLRFNMRNARNWSLGCYPANGGTDVVEKTVMSSRQGVWHCLRKKVPDEAIITGNSVKIVERKKMGGRRAKSEEVDFVIGADGVKSVARKAVLGDGNVDLYLPSYDFEANQSILSRGLVGVGGFVPTALLPPSAGSTTMTFGAQGFFGYSACSRDQISSNDDTSKCVYYGGITSSPIGRKAMWWSTYETEGVPDAREIDKDDVRKQLLQRHVGKQLLQRHEHWRDPTIRKIIHEVEIENLWPVWTTPKLPT
ncbi:MAG: hypothetical protein M1812_007232 [Candelaria pacifica]|nr:MAG: hypothetical protein M1812_007232 [Candelaria pacifica]